MGRTQMILIAAGWFLACPLAAQRSTGEIRGTVVDATGGVLVGVKVTAVDVDRAVVRTTQTSSAGDYLLASLPSGTYRLRFEAQGFNTQVLDGIELRVGDTVLLRTVLEVGTVATEVNVTAEPPVLDPGRTQQAATLDLLRVQHLPINRRNFLDFALLVPGVVDTDYLVDDTDFRVAQTPQSGLSFGGGNGRGNIVSIDGMENYYNSGGVRPSLSQEAVQEFQINRNSFTTELGSAVGGVVNIVSRSGTNDFAGNLFGFLRHRRIQARNYFDPLKSAFTRGQYGATAGGPLRKDKLFVFAAFERLDRQETAFVPILQDRSIFARLTPSQQELVNFFDASGSPQLRAVAAAMRQALIPNNHPRTVALFNQNSGNFPFSEDTTQASVRVDYRPSERHSFFLRSNLTSSFAQNAQFGALIAFNRGRSLDVFDGTVAASHTWVASPRTVVETRLNYGYNQLDVQPTDPLGPELNIAGFGFFGRDIFLPSTAWERHYQFQQHWNYHVARHGLKLGVDINPVRDRVRSETFFSGRFTFGGRVPLGLVLNNFTGDPNFTTRLAESLAAAGQARLIPNLSAPLTALQAFSLGLPEFYQQGFGDPYWTGWSRRYNFFAQDSWRISPAFTLNLGARYELEDNPEPVRTDPNNLAGRIGLAWAPGPRTVIRAGYGMYYSQINIQVANVADTLSGRQIAQTFVPLTGIPGLLNPRTGRLLTAADIYQTLIAQDVIGRRSIRLEDLAQFGLRPSPTAPFSVVFGIVDDFVNPYAHQASFELERAIGGVALSLAYNFNRGAHLVRNLDRNLFYTGRRPDGAPTFGFFNPLIAQRNIFESTANSFYHAGIVQVSKRFTGRSLIQASYTWSKAIDEVTDFNTDFQPHDQLNARAERALSAFHQAHRFIFTAVLQAPAGSSGGWIRRLGSGFTFAPIVIASSFRPFNVLAGVDNLGDRHSNTHRPLGAGRNIGKGPNFFTVDARLSRTFRLGAGERPHVEFIAEGFNLLNRTNFRTVNNTVGDVPLSSLPRPLTGRRGIPTEPLAFTSALDPRQFQFGVKINF